MTSLGAARQARGLSLDAIARSTGICLRHLIAIENGSFDKLPPGIYARSYVRTFAAAVHLDAAELEQILPLLPVASDPFPVLKQVSSPPPSHPHAVGFARSIGATLVDAMLLLLMSIAALVAVAGVCDVALSRLIEAAPLPLSVLCATIWLEYFLVFAGVQGRTVGEGVCGYQRQPGQTTLSLNTILRRAIAAPPDGRPELASANCEL